MRSTPLGLFAVSAVLTATLTGCIPTDGAVEPDPTGTVDAAPSPTDASPSPSTTPDPWAGHFDELASTASGEYVTQLWGSFGDVDATAPASNRDERLPAGEYDVEVQCAGAPEVDVRIVDLAGRDLVDPTTVSCPSASSFPIELAADGVEIALDNRGAPGAFLIRIADPAAE